MMSTVPFSSLDSGRMSMFSGSKWSNNTFRTERMRSAVEQLTGLYKQLTAYDLFIKVAVTAEMDHVVDGGLCPFDHSHLKGD